LYHPETDINHLTSPLVHIGTTLLLVFSAMFISLISCDLGFLLEITVIGIHVGGFRCNRARIHITSGLLPSISRWSPPFAQKVTQRMLDRIRYHHHDSLYHFIDFQVHE
jgi:hypothetical protein